MSRVGVRELRQRASELLRRVEAGEAFEITDRGRPVAVLGPISSDQLERLRAAGDLTPAQGAFDDLPMPLTPSDASELPSVTLARRRSHER
jgi:prevent-host-death family protein